MVSDLSVAQMALIYFFYLPSTLPVIVEVIHLRHTSIDRMNHGDNSTPRNANAMAYTNDPPSDSDYGAAFGVPPQNAGQGINAEADSAANFYCTGFTPTGMNIMPSVLHTLHPINNPLGVRPTGTNSWASPSHQIVTHATHLETVSSTGHLNRAEKIEMLAR